MRAHYLQHVPFEGLGSIESWLQNANYGITNTKFYESSVLPDVNEIDLLRFFKKDSNTKIIIGYIEQITNGKKLIKEAFQITKTKIRENPRNPCHLCSIK